MKRRGVVILAALALLTLAPVACSDDTTPPGNQDLGGSDGIVDAPQNLDALGDGKVGDGKVGDGKVGDGKVGDGKVGDGKVADAKLTDGPTSDASATDSFVFPDGVFVDGSNPGNQVLCHGKVYACSDGADNDGDKLIDAMDPECTGPCDNDESSMLLSIPGVNSDPCKQDCYWDYDSGTGNDDCDWSHKCDPKSPGAALNCPYDSNYTKCTTTQSATCLKVCLPITPNGCDCFGCCEIYVNGTKYKDTVFLGSGATCSAKTPQNCAACTQQTGCINTCGPCELCLGKTIKDLPLWCFTGKKDAGVPPGDGGPFDFGPYDGPTPKDMTTLPDGGIIIMPWCPPGVTSCLTNSQCPTNYYCITGCCQEGIS